MLQNMFCLCWSCCAVVECDSGICLTPPPPLLANLATYMCVFAPHGCFLAASWLRMALLVYVLAIPPLLSACFLPPLLFANSPLLFASPARTHTHTHEHTHTNTDTHKHTPLIRRHANIVFRGICEIFSNFENARLMGIRGRAKAQNKFNWVHYFCLFFFGKCAADERECPQ